MLSVLIQSQHLKNDSIDNLFEEYRKDTDRYLFLDNFLHPDKLDHIRQLVLNDGVMQQVYKTYSTKGWAEKQDFESTAEDQRFLFEKIYKGPRSGFKSGTPVRMDKLFRFIMRSQEFHSYLSLISGEKITRTGSINLKCLGRKHFLKRHGDGSPGRVACLILYLHENWCQEYKGRFIMHCGDSSQDIIDPVSNRLVLFDPRAETEHEVEAMSEQMGNWVRINYTVWFYNC